MMISQHFEMSASVKVVCVISIHIVFLGGTSTERCWTTASMISVALCTRVAPSRISWLQPFYLGSSGDPRMAITSLPRSPASRAVISNSDLATASVTTAPSARFGCVLENDVGSARFPGTFRPKAILHQRSAETGLDFPVDR